MITSSAGLGEGHDRLRRRRREADGAAVGVASRLAVARTDHAQHSARRHVPDPRHRHVAGRARLMAQGAQNGVIEFVRGFEVVGPDAVVGEDAHYSATVDLRQEVFGGILGDEITKALNSIPVDFRLIVLLSDIEGFTYEEMSKIIGIPIGTVRSRLHRARNMMKDKIKEYARSQGYKVDEA